jgi:glucosyl-3-phosphoglycerate synthase
MENILSVLKDSDYIDHLVIGLDAANAQQYQNVLQTLRDARLPTNIHVLWNDGPDIEKWRDQLASNAYEGRPLAPQHPGKGRNVWGCLGYTKALMQKETVDLSNTVVAMHDADITTYDEFLVARLFQPMCALEGHKIDYVKGYYTRYTTEKINARATRLFGPPLIDSVANVLQELPNYNKNLRSKVEYLRSFNYMFSGEMVFSGRLIDKIELPNDYSMELRLLDQVYNLTSETGQKIVDLEIAKRYDHHHQDVHGLEKMTTQIAAALFDVVNQKVPLTSEIIEEIKEKYSVRAGHAVEAFNIAAGVNCLDYNMQEELNTVQKFADSIHRAYDEMQEGISLPSHNWDVISRETPNATHDLLSAVIENNGVIPAQPAVPVNQNTLPQINNNHG